MSPHPRRLVLAAALPGVLAAAAAAAWITTREPPRFAVLDVAELYRAKETQATAVLVKREATEAERAAQLRHAAAFGAELAALLRTLPRECRCVVLARAAVVAAEPALPDLTPDVRRRLGL